MKNIFTKNSWKIEKCDFYIFEICLNHEMAGKKDFKNG